MSLPLENHFVLYDYSLFFVDIVNLENETACTEIYVGIDSEILQFLENSDLESNEGCTCNIGTCAYCDEINSVVFGEFFPDVGANLALN